MLARQCIQFTSCLGFIIRGLGLGPLGLGLGLPGLGLGPLGLGLGLEKMSLLTSLLIIVKQQITQTRNNIYSVCRCVSTRNTLKLAYC